MLKKIMIQNTAEIKSETNKINKEITKINNLLKDSTNEKSKIILLKERESWQKLLSDLQYNLTGESNEKI